MTLNNSDSITTTINTTILITSPPFSDISGKEGVDLALVCAAFDQKVNLVYIAHGVFHLLKNQEGDSINDKLHDKQLGALEFYDIDTIYCDKAAIERFNLSPDDLIDNCQIVATQEMKVLIENAKQTVTF